MTDPSVIGGSYNFLRAQHDKASSAKVGHGTLGNMVATPVLEVLLCTLQLRSRMVLGAPQPPSALSPRSPLPQLPHTSHS